VTGTGGGGAAAKRGVLSAIKEGGSLVRETSRRAFLLSGAVLLASTGVARANSALVTGGGRFRVPVTSFADMPWQTVIRQEFDFSCGAASAATMLTFHFNRPTTELEAFEAMWENGEQEKIQEKGFSLLDIKTYLVTIGYKSDGFRVSLDDVERSGVPAIFLIDLRGYLHFVVVKGIIGDTVLVGDPAFGLSSYSRAEFEDVWVDDIVFVITSNVDLARANFNLAADWKLDVKAPLGAGVDRKSLSSWSVRTSAFPAQFRPNRVRN